MQLKSLLHEKWVQNKTKKFHFGEELWIFDNIKKILRCSFAGECSIFDCQTRKVIMKVSAHWFTTANDILSWGLARIDKIRLFPGIQLIRFKDNESSWRVERLERHDRSSFWGFVDVNGKRRQQVVETKNSSILAMPMKVKCFLCSNQLQRHPSLKLSSPVKPIPCHWPNRQASPFCRTQRGEIYSAKLN